MKPLLENMIDEEMCEFCEQWVEELHPVYIGEIPSPKPVRVTETTAKSKKSETVAFGSVDGDIQVLGYPVDELVAIINCLENSEEFHLNTYQSVFEVDSFPHAQRVIENSSSVQGIKGKVNSYDSEVDDTKVSAEITVEPKRENIQPDLLVCEFCKGNMKGKENA